MDEYFPPLIWQWLDDQRNTNNESIDTATKDAANISGASQATSEAAKGTEPVNRKERTSYNAAVRPFEENDLQLWSKDNGLWISEHDFLRQYAARQIGSGAEQKVYLHENGREVIKVNTGTPSHAESLVGDSARPQMVLLFTLFKILPKICC
jgi:hypothetical protein